MSAKAIAIVGPSGSGKTWLGERLSARLSLPRLAIDDLGRPGGRRWDGMIEAVEDAPMALITDGSGTKRSVGHQTVVWEGRNPLEGKTDTGSHGPFDRYRVYGRGVVA